MLEIIGAALPFILQLAGMALTKFNASQQTLEAYDSLVAASKSDGLLPVGAKVAFLSQKAQLEQQLQADAQAAPKV